MSRPRLTARLTVLELMPAAALQAEWAQVLHAPAPTLPPDLLRRLLAFALQEKRHGGVPTAIARELERVVGSSTAPAKPPPVAIRPGTRLVREWQGRSIDVLATEDGFVWEERRYNSLTQIAREITGARWSGPRFFGLTRRG